MSAAPNDQPDESAVDDAIFEYGVDDRDDNEQLDPELAMGLEDETPLTDGYSPPDEPSGVDEFGTTVEEQMTGESLADRELRTQAEDWADPDTDLSRSDRLVDTQDGRLADTEADLVAREAEGDDDLSAEEAAIHRIDPDPALDRDPGTLALDEGSTNG
jgi:hypothetical protein